jgi:hypothetical protein
MPVRLQCFQQAKTCPDHLNTFKVDELAEDIIIICPPGQTAFAKGPNSAWTLLNDIVDTILGGKKSQPASADGFSQLISMANGAAELVPVMQQWVSKVRIAEGFLSPAQVTHASNLVEGSHNWQSSMIAKQNEEHGVSTARASMQQNWYWKLEHVFEKAIAPYLKEKVVKFASHFCPCFLKHKDGSVKYQVIVFKPYPDSTDVYCGVTLEVYRGAAVKPKYGAAVILDLLAYFRIL